MAKRATAAGPVEGPWALPDGWRWDRLEAVGRWGSGGTPDVKKAHYYGGDIAWFRSGELLDRPLAEPEIKITEEGLRGSSAKLIAPGAVLVAMYGATVGKLAISTRVCATNQAVAFCVPDLETITARYLFFYLLSIRRHLRDQAQGGAQPNISQSVLKEQIIPLPPLAHQVSIVARIDELFAEIDDGEAALARARDDLGTWRKALLKAAVTGELTADWRAANPPTETGADLLARILDGRRARWDAEPRNKQKTYAEPVRSTSMDVAALPTTWSWASIQQLATVVRGASPRPAGDPRYFGGDIPWITVGSLTKGNSKFLTSVDLFVTRLGREHSRYIEPGTLLFTNSGATLGVPKITSIGGCINDGSVALLGLEEPVKSYVYHFLSTQTERLRGLNQGAAQPNLNTTIVKEIIVPLPPEDEMAEIVSVVENFLNETDAGDDDLRHLDVVPSQLRQSILAAAFRGDLG